MGGDRGGEERRRGQRRLAQRRGDERKEKRTEGKRKGVEKRRGEERGGVKVKVGMTEVCFSPGSVLCVTHQGRASRCVTQTSSREEKEGGD